MKPTKAQLNKIEKYAFQNAEKEGMPHDINHIKAVTRWAVYLASKEKANMQVCYVAALLHDIALSKVGDKGHEEKGAEITKRFLLKMKLNPHFVDQVAHAVGHHASSLIKNAKTKEAQIVYEADKCDVVFISGLLRLRKDPTKKKWLDSQILDQYIKNQDKVYKLFKTKTAKKLARPSYQLMRRLYKEYKKWR